MKRHATTIVMFVLAVALSIYLLVDREKVSTSESKLRAKNAFSAWRKDDLSRIEIIHDDETIVLQRESGVWQMRAPRASSVDGPAVDRLLGTLEYATRVRSADEGAKGMAPLRAHGAVTMGDLTFRFGLGGSTPRPECSSYFRVDDGAPFVVSKELADALLAPADTYRDRTVVPYLSTEIRRFDVEGHFVLDRLDDRSFLAGGLLASRATVDKVWAALAEVRAESFANDEALIASPRLVLAITPKDSTKPDAELVFGAACPGHPADVVVVRTKPTRVEACVPRVALDVLSGLTAPDLAERHPFFFHHDEIEELRLEPATSGAGAGHAIEVARRGTGYHLREPEDRELDGGETEAMSELFRLIESSVAEEAPAHAPFSGAIGRAKIRVGEVEEIVEVGALDLVRHEARLHRVRDDAVLRVSLPVARRLLARSTVLHPLAITPDHGPVTQVRLRCGTAQDLADDGTGLRLVSPTGYATDGAVTQLVDAIAKGKAITWVADADDGTFGLDGGCKVSLGDTTVRFGSEADGGSYATIEGHEGVFVIPLAVRALAERIYVSHALLGPEPVTALTVNGRAVATVGPATNLIADRVVTLASSEVGRSDLVLEVTQATAATPRHRITCGPVGEHWRRCAVTGTKAVFDVYPGSFDDLLGARDAGAQDAGADASIDRDAARP